MDTLTVKQRDHMTRLIRKELSFYIGSDVSADQLESACFRAACKVANYLVKKAKRDDPNRPAISDGDM
jgi:hypothetical protein